MKSAPILAASLMGLSFSALAYQPLQDDALLTPSPNSASFLDETLPFPDEVVPLVYYVFGFTYDVYGPLDINDLVINVNPMDDQDDPQPL